MLYNCNHKIVIIMSGLPARGKSYTANKIIRYFNWSGYKTQLFNVGNYRRTLLGGFQDSSFFNPDDKKAFQLREEIALNLMKSLLIWLNTDGNNIGIFDATNTTIERRHKLVYLSESYGFTPIFIENICNDNELIKDNLKMKLMSPDYVNIDENIAKIDFFSRLNNYNIAYEPLHIDENIEYIKIINNNSNIEVVKVDGSLEKELLCYLIHLKINKNPIYLSRHGESEFNTLGKIGGNSSLSKNGILYKQIIKDYFLNEINNNNLIIFTSTLVRTIETSEFLKDRFTVYNYKLLDEINAGICDGMTYQEIKEKYPEIAKERKSDKFNYRYPMGESYCDIVNRLKSFILEMERIIEPILIISHNAITRVIYSYLMNIPQIDIPHFDIPLHTIIKLVPNSEGYREERIKL